MKFTIETEEREGESLVRLTIHHTGEIREARDLETILRSLVRDYGFYLRRV